MRRNKPPLTRRDFLKKGGTLLGGAAATAAFGKPEHIVEVIATAGPHTEKPTVPALAPGVYADTIFVNGNIITMDAAAPLAQAIAIKDGLIAQVGADNDIRALADETTQVIDLAGKTMTPGLIDAHNHLHAGGRVLASYEPFPAWEVRTLDVLLSRMSEVVARTPPGEWIQGYYWYVETEPTIQDLDSVAPNNPVWLMQQGGHYALANSLALSLAGVTADTPTPPGGVIEQDANGELTGMFYNHRAMDVLRRHIPQPTDEEVLVGLHTAERYMIEAGVTTYQDCNARFAGIRVYADADQEGAMVLPGQVYYTVEWPADLQRALNEMPNFADENLDFVGYKFLIDGQYPTWYTHEPHPGVSWDMPTWDPDNFKLAVRRLHDTGLQIAVHCGGDASVDLALDAFEEAMNANPRPDPRHRLEHAVLSTEESVGRIADLGVHVSTQPQFIRFFTKLRSEIGEERSARIIVTRDWLNAGVNVALGSDVPSTPWYRPNITLLAAVTRPDGNVESFNLEQALTIEEALYAHTMGSAKAGFEEHVKGSLEPGKLADLVVWSDNFYTVEPMAIPTIMAELTMIGGEIVYQV